MVFSSQIFIFYFLPVSLAVYYLLAGASQKVRNLWLALTGYVFYGWAEPRFILLMFATTTLDWMLSLVIARDRWLFWRQESLTAGPGFGGRRPASLTQRRALQCSVVSNLCALGFFKYFNFAMESWNAAFGALGIQSAMVDSTLRVVLPLGISFYTFQALSYIIDVYRGEADAMEDFVDFSCFVSMFPHLVAGPILKFSFLAQQLRERTLSGAKFARGMAFFWMGLGKKVLLANPCAQMADASFDSGARSALEAWAGVVAYALQIYYDFSGYSDMAIGLGLMFGFYFAKNFNAPYRSTSVTEFWRRWHISLSCWLRDYLYIPLGGNRYGGGRTYLNLFVTMLLGGLWHGASWNYLIWGAWHGGVLAAERALKAAGFLKISGFAGGVFTSAVVLVGWVFFRSADLPSSLKYLSNMFGFGSISGESAVCWREPYLLFSFGVALLLVFLGKQTWDWTQRMTVWKVGAVAAIGGAGLVALLTQDYNPFIYYIF